MSKLTPLIPFGEWLPDLGELNNPGATIAKNVVCLGKDRYAPLKDLIDISNALNSRCLGAAAFITDDGNIEIFAGTATKLYRFGGLDYVTDETGAYVTYLSAEDFVTYDGDGNIFNDVTRASGNYATTSGRWEFAVYGNRLYATNFDDEIQTFNLQTGEKFEDLKDISTGIPPRCRSLAVVNNFLVAFGCVDPSDGDKFKRLRWSAIDNPLNWTIAASTQADQQDVYGDMQGSGAKVLGFGDYGILVFQREVWRFEYVGSPLVFTFKRVTDGIGSPYQGSVVKAGSLFFFLSERGFMMHDGINCVPIGDGKVDKFFNKKADANYLNDISSAHDSVNSSVLWSFATQDGDGSYSTMQFIFNYLHNKWTYAETQNEMLFTSITTGKNIDGLDSIYASLDDIPNSLDDASFLGGRDVLAAFTKEHKMSFFMGDALEGVIETAEIRLNPSGSAFLRGVVPVVDSSSPAVRILSRGTQTGTLSDSGFKSKNPRTEQAEFRIDARYMRAQVKTGTDYTVAQGVQLNANPSGML